jgi:branched-chain amino acid transport system substrate-binding protein
MSTFPKNDPAGLPRTHLIHRIPCCAAVALVLYFTNVAALAAEPVFIGLDDALNIKSNTSAKAIERGTLDAIEEISAMDGVLGGRPLQLLLSDNQSLLARLRVPLTSVWGSANPMTDGVASPSSAFRLSLQDSWGPRPC